MLGVRSAGAAQRGDAAARLARGLRTSAAACKKAGYGKLGVLGKKQAEPKQVELPKLDLEEMLGKATGVRVHNPLLEIERAERAVERKRKEEIVEKQKRYIPATPGSRPLPLMHEYLCQRDEFLEARHGIESTPTQRFQKRNGADPQPQHDVSWLFRTLPSPSAQKTTMKVCPGEFEFPSVSIPYTFYLGYLELYVRALHSVPTAEAAKYYDDFFVIIKAIRQRPKVHTSVSKTTQFKDLVMRYLLLCGLNRLALLAAIMLVPKTIPAVLSRWSVMRLIGLPELWSPLASQAKQIEGGVSEGNANLTLEYHYNVLVHSCVGYYYERPEITMTDTELVGLVRCVEARRLCTDLKDMLVPVIRRCAAGLPDGLSDIDTVELSNEREAAACRVSELQAGARYALALVRVAGVEAGLQFLRTMADMPARPVPGLQGTTADVARAIIAAGEAAGSGAAGVMEEMLAIVSKNAVEDPVEMCQPGSMTTLLVKRIAAEAKGAKMAEAKSTKAAEAKDAGIAEARATGTVDALTRLLCALASRVRPAAATAVIQKLDQQKHTSAALRWVGDNFQRLDRAAQDAAIGWVVEKLQARRDLVTAFIRDYAMGAPLAAAQFGHVLTRRLWDQEADRRFVQTRVFGEVLRSRQMPALGVTLVSAALGPDTPVLSPFGPQSLGERSRATARLLAQIAQKTTPDVPLLMPYLFKVAGSLQARETEAVLWREVLRRGLRPDWRMLQTAISLRMSRGYGREQALELIGEAIRQTPIVQDSAQDAAQDTAQDTVQDAVQDAVQGITQETGPTLPTDSSALYMAILDGLNKSGNMAAFEVLAEHLLDSGRLSSRTFGALASSWLDAVGRQKGATSDDVQQAWAGLKSRTGAEAAYALNRNHYHSAIEAFVRVGDVEAAWAVVRTEMRAAGLEPDVKTLYTLASPLASNMQLWAQGKAMVARFAEHYPRVAEQAAADKSNTLTVKALLRQALDARE
ncbi:hypothetical protein H4R18_000313 [Coemansia javaensis]|uniref:Uncharacterized protein n=1 Tax=Coemansia javaensis TaxID=2761396 RepID=A0A9W8HK15_9FUNG|nr:hypothetical protein H4R18_000313 [Coemansia javaensis]